MLFVLDCSVAISWCLHDEDNAYANAIYNIISKENQAIVPAFFGWKLVMFYGSQKKEIAILENTQILLLQCFRLCLLLLI